MTEPGGATHYAYDSRYQLTRIEYPVQWIDALNGKKGNGAQKGKAKGNSPTMICQVFRPW